MRLPTILVLTVLTVLLVACDRAPETRQLQGRTMGTSWSVQWVGRAGDEGELQQAIEQRLGVLNDRLSTWLEDSEISRLNRASAAAPQALSPDLLVVLREADRVHRLSAGAYDPSVAPLMRLWGFHGDGAPAVPSPADLQALRPAIGFDLLELEAAAGQATKQVTALELDLSSIGKGYAVDELSALLTSEGLDRHLVEIGGELRARGRRSDGMPWRIAIEVPASPRQEPQPIVPLDNLAIATSGDYRQYFEQDGRRYAHILDPRTGEPPESKLAAVTVVAASAMSADALATTFMVLGPRETLAWAEREGLAVYLIERTADGYRSWTSSSMDRLLAAPD